MLVHALLFLQVSALLAPTHHSCLLKKADTAEVDCPALEPGPDTEICSAGGSNSKCRWTLPLSSQLSPYGSSLGCSLETPYGI